MPEILAIFLDFPIPKLPAPKEQVSPRGVLKAIEMDSYRVEAQASLKMSMDEAAPYIEPPRQGGGSGGQPDIDKLSNIIKAFNDLFGIEWNNADKIRRSSRQRNIH